MSGRKMKFVSNVDGKKYVASLNTKPCMLHIFKEGIHSDYSFGFSLREAYEEALMKNMPEALFNDYNAYCISLGLDLGKLDIDIKLQEFLDLKTDLELKSYLDNADYEYLVDNNLEIIIE